MVGGIGIGFGVEVVERTIDVRVAICNLDFCTFEPQQ
jgi:hypothetical protein